MKLVAALALLANSAAWAAGPGVADAWRAAMAHDPAYAADPQRHPHRNLHGRPIGDRNFHGGPIGDPHRDPHS